MNQKTVFIAALLALVAVFGAGTYAYRTQQAQQAAATAAKNRQVLVRMHSPTLGRAEAPVHIVEFFDPACETCAAMYPLVKQMMAAERDNIRLTIRYAPLHPGSDQLVLALEASRRQGRFWQALEALIAAQPTWVLNHQAHIDRAWPAFARAGLDLERLKNDMQSPEVARAVAQDVADARAMKVTKTPEFFVNGRPLPSFGLEQLRDLVAEELAANAKRPD